VSFFRVPPRLTLDRVEERYTPDTGRGNPDGYGWRAWVSESAGRSQSVDVWISSSQCRHGELTLEQWIGGRLERWPSDNYDPRSHLQQLLDAAPIQLFPED
jgi:hypothetical protein